MEMGSIQPAWAFEKPGGKMIEVADANSSHGVAILLSGHLLHDSGFHKNR